MPISLGSEGGMAQPLEPTLRIIREVERELLRAPARLPDAQIRFIASPAFTRSGAWVRLRYDFMRDHDGRCQCCGRRASDGVKVNVDHILPRRTHPQFALCYANLQVLCGPCNRGKGNRDRTDWRYRAAASGVRSAPCVAAIPSCPACRAPMQRREGRHGAFWGCSRFPVCRGTRDDGPSGRARRHRSCSA